MKFTRNYYPYLQVIGDLVIMFWVEATYQARNFLSIVPSLFECHCTSVCCAVCIYYGGYACLMPIVRVADQFM